MKLLQEIACQRTLSKALKRKLGVSRLGEEQMSCWLVSKKTAIPLFICERGQGKTSHYVCYCTKCCTFHRNSCWDSWFPRIAGVKSCLCMTVVYLEIPTSTDLSHNLSLSSKQRDHLMGTQILTKIIVQCCNKNDHPFSDVSTLMAWQNVLLDEC